MSATKKTLSERLRWIVGGALIGLLIASLVYRTVQEGSQTSGLPEGSEAPPFEIERLGGGTISLAELRGRVVVLDFWATWCPPCRDEMPTLLNLARELEPRGMVLVAADRIQSDSRAAVGVFMARLAPELPANVTVALTPEQVLGAYDVHALPTLYVIDREGRIAAHHRGYTSERMLRRTLERVLGD